MSRSTTHETIEYIVIKHGSRHRLLAKPTTFELLMKRSCEIFEFTADTRLCAYFMYRNRLGDLVEMELDPSAYTFLTAWDELEWKIIDTASWVPLPDAHNHTGPKYLGDGHDCVSELEEPVHADDCGQKTPHQVPVEDWSRAYPTRQGHGVDNFPGSWDNEVANSLPSSHQSHETFHDREATSTPIGRLSTLPDWILKIPKGAGSPSPRSENDAASDDGWPKDLPRSLLEPVSINWGDCNHDTPRRHEPATTSAQLMGRKSEVPGAFSPRPGRSAVSGNQWLHPIPGGPLRTRPTGGRWALDYSTPTKGRRRTQDQ